MELRVFMHTLTTFLIRNIFYSLQTSPNTASLSDYSKISVPVTFLPGESGPKYVEINITDDELLEDKEKFTVFLTSNVPRVSVGRPASVEIIDNEGM